MACSLCRAPMTPTDEVASFAPFIADPDDPLHLFSDGAFHAACVARNPLAAEATAWHRAAREPHHLKRACEACGERVLDPNDHFGAGILSRDQASPLFAFNFVTLHRSHAVTWRRFSEFRRHIEARQALPSWRGTIIAFDPSPRWQPHAAPRR
jgi:hypothetical protein